MGKSLIAIPLFLVLAACSGQPADADAPRAVDTSALPEPVPADADDTAVATAIDASAEAAGFPMGARLDATHLLVEERNYLADNKAKRRRTTYQVAGATVDVLAGDIRRQMVEAGFRDVDVDSRGDGVSRLGFRKPGVGRVNVGLRPDVETPLLEGATGELFFDWLLVPAPESAPESAPDSAPAE